LRAKLKQSVDQHEAAVPEHLLSLLVVRKEERSTGPGRLVEQRNVHGYLHMGVAGHSGLG
jgi:hypothetical protein